LDGTPAIGLVFPQRAANRGEVVDDDQIGGFDHVVIELLAFLAGKIGQAIRLKIGSNQLQAIRWDVGFQRIDRAGETFLQHRAWHLAVDEEDAARLGCAPSQETHASGHGACCANGNMGFADAPWRVNHR
jgi:hypothetical protein